MLVLEHHRLTRRKNTAGQWGNVGKVERGVLDGVGWNRAAQEWVGVATKAAAASLEMYMDHLNLCQQI